jgi:hypothetical protein
MLVGRSIELHKASHRCEEATRVEIEFRQFPIEIDMEPYGIGTAPSRRTIASA